MATSWFWFLGSLFVCDCVAFSSLFLCCVLLTNSVITQRFYCTASWDFLWIGISLKFSLSTHYHWAGSRQHSQRNLFVGQFFVTCFVSVSFFLFARKAATPWPLCGKTNFYLSNMKLESASSNLQAPILPIVLVAICQQDWLMLFLLFHLIDVAFNTSFVSNSLVALLGALCA